MNKLHLILTGFTLSLIALSLNRLTDWFAAPLAPHEFLRWLDFNAMLPIPLVMVGLYYLAKRNVQRNGSVEHDPLYPSLLFISGVYLFGASLGDHETMNYVSVRFCDWGRTESELCAIVAYHDDVFSHLLYFAGAIAMQVSVLWLEFRAPRRERMRTRDVWLIAVNAAFIAIGIFANLAFEETLIDMTAFTIVLVIAGGLLWRQREQWRNVPFIFYTALAYAAGLGAAIIIKLG